MRTASKAIGPAFLLALCGGVVAAPIETLVLPPESDPAPLISEGTLGSGANRVVLVTPTSSGTVRSLRITGSLTGLSAFTLGEDARIQITPPGREPITVAPFAGVSFVSTVVLTGYGVQVPEVAADSGAWEIRFYEVLDDQEIDAEWADGLTIVLDDGPFAVTPPAATDLGALPVGPSSVAEVSIAPGAVTWYRFTTTGAAAANGTFLDIDTEFSGNQDTQIALYRPDGTLLASDDQSGSVNLSQLSFGAGTRCSTPSAEAYDGRDGEVPAGEYYLAVGYYNSAFLSQFNAASDAAEGGTVRLNFNTGVQVSRPTPVPVANLGNIGSTPAFATTLTVEVPAGGAAWYRFDAPAGITARGAREYLDIDTEGSESPAALRVYSSTGDLVASDAGSGSAANSRLSFGQGYRAAVGDGSPYDGVSGVLAPGSYFLAVTTGVPSAAANGFVLCGTNGGESIVTVNIRSGVQPVAEAPTATDLGTINVSNRNVAATGVSIGEREVKWFRFTLALDNTAPDFFLDIDTEGSDLLPDNDTEIRLFDTSGNVVIGGLTFAIDDDGGSRLLSQLTFGNAPARQAVGDSEPYDNRDGTLVPATYYLAVAGFSTNAYLDDFAVFSTSGNTGTIDVNIRTALVAVPLPCLADVNGDGTVDGTDFILFINSFAIGDSTVDPVADVAGGGNPALPEGGADGTIDGTDFIAFINAFAAGC